MHWCSNINPEIASTCAADFHFFQQLQSLSTPKESTRKRRRQERSWCEGEVEAGNALISTVGPGLWSGEGRVGKQAGTYVWVVERVKG